MNAETADPLLGCLLLGRYRVARQLAKGGMGAVYLGRTEGGAGFTRPVVIKRMLPDLLADSETTRMFVREAHILSHLRHPSIVSVLDFGDDNGAKIMVLEYVHGYDVARWCSYLESVKRPVRVDHGIRIMTHVLDGLHHAHTAKRSDGTALMIVHRDVSPTNILIDVEGHIKIADFGIARITGDPSEYKTQEASFKGKIGYAPPELLQGEDPSARSDVYSAAVVLYQMLAGFHPFRGVAVTDTVRNVLTQMPRPIHELRPDAPPELEALLVRGMAKEPADRFASAQELATALRQVVPSSHPGTEQDFHTTIEHDFADGQMAAKMGYEALSVRDEAWRLPTPARAALMPTKRPGAAHRELVASARACVASASHGPASHSPRRSSSPTALIVAVAALTLAVVGVGAVLVLQKLQAAPRARYLVVEKDHSSESVATERAPSAFALQSIDPEPQALSAAAAPMGSSSAHPAGSSARASGPRGGAVAAALTQAFHRQMGPIHGCLTEHQEQLGAGATLSVAFSVDRNGAVDSVGLSPASLASTRGGQCILAAARRMSFGPQPDAVFFSIPITVGYR
jgi:serine/threonine protein kinase